MDFIDLRSDVKTLPPEPMLRAMATAELGDDQAGEDPTVTRLEERVAELTGLDTAIFVPSATMANQLALLTQVGRGEEVIAEQHSHILRYEAGGPAALAGAVMTGLPGHHGTLDAAEVGRVAFTGDSEHRPRTRMAVVENTHNVSGGRVWPLTTLDALYDTCVDLGVAVHIDGARIFNAVVAQEAELSRITGRAQSISICFSKGLCCPGGAVLAGRTEAMGGVRRLRQMLGGSMRQSGVLAAAAYYALDHLVDRLAEDHLNARALVEGLAAAGLPVQTEAVETNFVFLDVGRLGLDADRARRLLAENGVGWSATHHPGVLRAVTHRDVSAAAIPAAIERTVRSVRLD